MDFCKTTSRIWNQFFFTGFSGESLGLLRMYIGVGLLFFHTYQFATVLTLNPIGAMYYFIEPIWYFKLLGIQYHVPAFSFVMYAILMGATIAMISGKNTRTSIVVIILCIFYLKGVRDSFSGDVHHRYIIPMQILFLFLLSKCGEVHSRDAMQIHHPGGVKEWEASWPIKTMQLYVALFLFLECHCQSSSFGMGLVRWRRQNPGSLNSPINPMGRERKRRSPQKCAQF